MVRFLWNTIHFKYLASNFEGHQIHVWYYQEIYSPWWRFAVYFRQHERLCVCFGLYSPLVLRKAGEAKNGPMTGRRQRQREKESGRKTYRLVTWSIGFMQLLYLWLESDHTAEHIYDIVGIAGKCWVPCINLRKINWGFCSFAVTLLYSSQTHSLKSSTCWNGYLNRKMNSRLCFKVYSRCLKESLVLKDTWKRCWSALLYRWYGELRKTL